MYRVTDCWRDSKNVGALWILTRPEAYVQVQKLVSECRLMENWELGGYPAANDKFKWICLLQTICPRPWCVCARISLSRSLDDTLRVWHCYRGFLWASFPWILSAVDRQSRTHQTMRSHSRTTVVRILSAAMLDMSERWNYFFERENAISLWTLDSFRAEPSVRGS